MFRYNFNKMYVHTYLEFWVIFISNTRNCTGDKKANPTLGIIFVLNVKILKYIKLKNLAYFDYFMNLTEKILL